MADPVSKMTTRQPIAMERRMADQTADPDSDFIDRCEGITHDGIVISEESRLRLFRLSGHTEEPPNYMIAWPSVWAMIADARERTQTPGAQP